MLEKYKLKTREMKMKTKDGKYRRKGSSTARSSSTAYMRGSKAGCPPPRNVCSLYPLLIERSALGSTGVDWTHQQPLTVAPSHRPLPPTLPYVRKNIYIYCICMCVCVCRICMLSTWESEIARQPKDAQNAAPKGGTHPRGWLVVRFRCALEGDFS